MTDNRTSTKIICAVGSFLIPLVGLTCAGVAVFLLFLWLGIDYPVRFVLEWLLEHVPLPVLWLLVAVLALFLYVVWGEARCLYPRCRARSGK